MNLPKNILVPTDFSPGAGDALEYAVTLASKLDAKVHLLNVVSLQTLGAAMGVPVTSSVVESIFDGNQKELDRLIASHAGRCQFAPAVMDTGDARAQIEHQAAKLHADLIVMGTHGRRGFQRLLIGSVAEAIARVAPCPVLLVRHSET